MNNTTQQNLLNAQFGEIKFGQKSYLTENLEQSYKKLTLSDKVKIIALQFTLCSLQTNIKGANFQKVNKNIQLTKLSR